MPHIDYNAYPKQTVLHKTHCCGIMEIDCLGLSQTPIDALKAIVPYIFQGIGVNVGRSDYYAPRFITFSGVVGTKVFTASHDGPRKDDYGQAFADYLVANNLGAVVATEPKVNWTKNSIRLWVWAPDLQALWSFCDANGIVYNTHEIVEEVELPNDDEEEIDEDA